MSLAIRTFVRERAENRCEYCRLHQDDSPLAALHVACIDCNLHKGSNLTGIDPDSGSITPLFHPRQQQWQDHFRWNGIHLAGKTDVGRTTIHVLCMNSDEQLELRMSAD